MVFLNVSDKRNLDIQRVVGYRQWCNKLWNAVRFAISTFGNDYVLPANVNLDKVLCIHVGKTNCAMFLLKQLSLSLPGMIQSLSLREVLLETHFGYVLTMGCDCFILLCHVTEELWQRLPSSRDQTAIESIMMCKYPSIVEGWRNKRVEYDMDLVDSPVKSHRSLANERCERRTAFVRDSEFAEIIKSHELEIITLANLSSLRVISENDVTTAGCAVSVVNENLSDYLELQGTLSPKVEFEK